MNNKIQIYNDKILHDINENIYGQFIEHLARCVNGGIFDPLSKLSDENGFRLDVMEKIKTLSPPVLRWPGGTFSKIYHWEDGVGPKSSRKKKRNLIWGGIEDNLFGTHEFIKYCREIDTEPFISVNMVTGSPEEAAKWVEYCNGDGDTYYANLRRENGSPEPFNVKYWGIGNEEYANCDVGGSDIPEDYIKKAWEFIKLMKLTDDKIKLILVGQTKEWNEKIITELGDVCDYISLHFYARTDKNDYTQIYRTLSDLEEYILDTKEIISRQRKEVVEFPKWYRFSPRKNPIEICLDEWNIWEDRALPSDEDPYALDIPYNFADALWAAGVLNLFHKNSDVITLATLAQTVNVLGAIRTNKEGSICQSIFYPLELYRDQAGDKYLRYNYNSKKLISPEGLDEVDELDISVTSKGEDIILMVVNRNLNEIVDIDVSFTDGIFYPYKFIELNTDDVNEFNKFNQKTNVEYKEHDIISCKNNVLSLNPHSINCIKFRRE